MVMVMKVVKVVVKMVVKGVALHDGLPMASPI